MGLLLLNDTFATGDENLVRKWPRPECFHLL